MRFFLIDRIIEWEPGKQATAIKNISLSEDFFQDHFPLYPIMPGVLILEGMAQLAGTLLQAAVAQENGRSIIAIMSIVDKAKFRNIVVPGDTLIYNASIDTWNDMGGKVTVYAHVDEKAVAECQLTFVFHDLDDPVAVRKRSEVLSLWLGKPSSVNSYE